MHTLLLSLRMLARDARAGELPVLLAALVIAVASVTSVGFFADRVGRALTQESHQLIGADLVVSADRPMPEEYASQATAEGLKSLRLYVPREALPETEEDEFYLTDLAPGRSLIEYLVAQGVPTDVVNDHGETALQTALNQEIVRWKIAREGAVGKDGDLNAVLAHETSDTVKKAMGIKKVASN